MIPVLKSGGWIMRSTVACLMCVLVHSTTITAAAQTYAIDWHIVAGGGGVSANGNYAVDGTIGQAAVNHSAGGRFAVDAGFWGFAAAIQMPGVPELAVRLSLTNTVIISWPSPASGFILQSSSIGSGGGWSPVSATPSDDGVVRSVVVGPLTGNRFFRLVK